MKKNFLQKQLYPLLLLTLFITSCKGQNKATPTVSAPQDSIPAPKISIDQAFIPNFLDKDPYFVETTTINSAYGPSSITRNIVQDKS